MSSTGRTGRESDIATRLTQWQQAEVRNEYPRLVRDPLPPSEQRWLDAGYLVYHTDIKCHGCIVPGGLPPLALLPIAAASASPEERETIFADIGTMLPAALLNPIEAPPD